jgi:class 3 adenylate cyclase
MTLSGIREQSTHMTDEHDGATQALERKLATILSADVAAYSRLMAQDEEQTLRTFRGHKQVFESLVAMHRGRIFNTAGDAILAEFGSTVEAVRCATEIQAALRTRNDQLPPSRQVRFRIGVNLGDVMVQGQDLLGDGVNLAARLQAAAEPGGICVSGSVHDQIRNKLSLSFQSLGEMNFKNIPQPVRTFSISGVDGQAALPSPKGGWRSVPGLSAKWLAAFALLVLIAAGSWAYSRIQQNRAEQARLLVEAEVTKREAAQREARLTAEKLAAEEAQRRAEAEHSAAETARREMLAAAKRAATDAERTKADVSGRVAIATPQQTRVLPAAPAPTQGAGPDGRYAGPVCYGPGPIDPPRCFRAQATVSQGKISGQWPGRDPGVTMHMTGDVSPSGEVKIEMHTENADGARRITIDMSGTLRDDRLDASGSFRNGRTVSLNWRKDLSGPH